MLKSGPDGRRRVGLTAWNAVNQYERNAVLCSTSAWVGILSRLRRRDVKTIQVVEHAQNRGHLGQRNARVRVVTRRKTPCAKARAKPPGLERRAKMIVSRVDARDVARSVQGALDYTGATVLKSQANGAVMSPRPQVP